MPDDFAFPLSEFYVRTTLALPRLEVLAGDALPEPYRGLLRHEHDMTSTLERFHGAGIYIHALRSERREEGYFRLVVLRRTSDDVPVECGANCVDLQLFTPEARWMLLQEKVPMGRILKDHAIPHAIRVPCFFRVEPDALICRALGLAGPVSLYGRQAVIANAAGQPLSRVVEILPPLPPNPCP
jgi:hypothetical protein